MRLFHSSFFNFARHWKSKIVLHLDDIDYRKADPPWLCGRGQWNGQRVREGCLSCYQPWMIVFSC